MHRDHKLALALALLLIGVAAALCFPRQDPAPLAELELENTDQLDAAIDQLPVRVYTESHTRPADEPQPAPVNPALKDPFAEFALLPAAPDPIPLADVTRPASERPAAANPIPPARIQVEAWPDTIPDATATATTDSSLPAEAAEASDPLIHEVRPGDTLSGLAGRYLGSTARFLELYEANRDVLSSPDDLRIGMRLRIPRIR